MFKNFIQIAGIIDIEEANLVMGCGVNYLGFPLRLTVNKEDLSEDNAKKIFSALKSPNYGVLITYLNRSEEIEMLLGNLGAEIIQLHGNIEITELKKLRKHLPQIKIIKSLIVGKYSKANLFYTIDTFSEYVDAFITDSFNTETKATGATGLIHDWKISKALREYSSKPIILAGGLTPDNVYEAIINVMPAGVDSHTGVENELGRKDRNKVKKFVAEAERGFNKTKEIQNDLSL